MLSCPPLITNKYRSIWLTFCSQSTVHKKLSSMLSVKEVLFMMRNRFHIGINITIVGVIFFLRCLPWPTDVWGNDSPLEAVRSTTNKAREVLSRSVSSDTSQRQQEREQMWEVVLPQFDS